ncbi:hypothetical protein [Enterocloster citroniae]
MNRALDGVYFRIQRDGKWQNICFSDLTETEMQTVMEGRTTQWLESLQDILSQVIDDCKKQCCNEEEFKSVCMIMGKTVREIGDKLDIASE